MNQTTLVQLFIFEKVTVIDTIHIQFGSILSEHDITKYIIYLGSHTKQGIKQPIGASKLHTKSYSTYLTAALMTLNVRKLNRVMLHVQCKTNNSGTGSGRIKLSVKLS